MKVEQSETLQVMIRLTVQINNHQHEWCMKRNKQHAPVIVTHKKLMTIYYDLYKLQLMNLDTTHRCLEWFKETECF